MNSDPNHPTPERAADGREPGSARDRAISEAIADFIDRSAKEEYLDVDTFCASYSELKDELRPALEALRAIDTVLDEGDSHEADKAAGASSLDSAQLPERLSGHKILREIGAGGMGRVFLAYDEGLRRNVAIKTLSAKFSGNLALQTRFMQEARALAQLRHPNIVSIYSLGKPGEPAHFVMEFVEGATLLQAARGLSITQKAELMRKVALAVDFLTSITCCTAI